MPITGRPTKPTALKELAGNPGKRPLNKREPKVSAPVNLRVPAGMPDDAAKLWRKLAPQMTASGMLKSTDLHALEMLCLHWAAARRAWKLLDKGGILIKGRQGDPVKNPAQYVWRSEAQAFAKLASEFGLTPAARSRILADEPDQEKSLADLLFEAVNTDAD